MTDLDLTAELKKDKDERERKRQLIAQCAEYLESQGYVVHTEGAYCSSVAEDRRYQAEKKTFKW
jgi:hypothetical protein